MTKRDKFAVLMSALLLVAIFGGSIYALTRALTYNEPPTDISAARMRQNPGPSDPHE